MASTPRPAAGSVSIPPILAVNFVGTLGFSVVLPFLVFLVTRWGGNAFLYGVMGATYPAFQLVGAPLLGRWSDRLGRRRVLLWSQLGTLASWAIFALPEAPLLRVDSDALGTFAVTAPLIAMFLARAFDGITGGNVSVANAYLADITPEAHRAESFGKMAVAANLGFILGPALAGLLSGTPLGELAPVLAALSISLVATLLIVFRLPEVTSCTLAADPEPPNVRTVFGQEPKRCFRLHAAERLTLRGALALGDAGPVSMIRQPVHLGRRAFVALSLTLAGCRLPFLDRSDLADQYDGPRVTSDLEGLREKLERYAESLRRAGFPVDELAPGATPLKIEQATAGLDFALPPELKTLYTWHDGTPADGELFFVRDQKLSSLQQGVQDIRWSGLHGIPRAFPFAGFEGSFYVLPADACAVNPLLESRRTTPGREAP